MFFMNIRIYKPDDCEKLIKLFYDTVHCVNARDYTPAQLNAWASGRENAAQWNQAFLANYTVVADKNGAPVGFGDIDRSGYLDRLYVHRLYQGRGIATAICDELEKSVDTSIIFTHASITAKPFFLGRGYKTVKEQQVIKNGVALTNFVMEKRMTLNEL